MKKRYTLDDIARMAGVSKTTVSRVLSGSNTVKQSTKEIVCKVIREANYAPSFLESYSLEETSRIVAVLIPEIQNQFWGEFVQRIQQGLFQNGFMLSLFCTGFDPEIERQCIERICECNTAGIIAVSHLCKEEAVDAYGALRCPVTFLNRVIECENCNAIIQDNFQAGYIATKHLIERGHERILFISGPLVSPSIEQRLNGYKAALENSFIPVCEDWIRYGEIGVERGIAEAEAICRMAESGPVAVVVTNDETAIGLIDECRARGVRIPESIAVVSFDNVRLAQLHCFDLTSVRQPIGEISTAAVEATLSSIRGESPPQKRIVLQPELVIRGSSGIEKKV